MTSIRNDFSQFRNEVYIDDAPWRQGEDMKLHPRISADDGRILGCTSARLELARQCEEDNIFPAIGWVGSVILDCPVGAGCARGRAGASSGAIDMSTEVRPRTSMQFICIP